MFKVAEYLRLRLNSTKPHNLKLNEIQKLKFDIKLQNHIWFWGSYFTLNFLRWGAYFNDYPYSFKSNLIEFSLHIPLVYFNLFVLVPKFVLKQKYIQYTFALLLSLFGIYLFNQLDYAWWWFLVLILAPDFSMIGYVFGNKAGAFLYNIFHHKGIALLIYGLGCYLSIESIRTLSVSRSVCCIHGFFQSRASSLEIE